MKRAEIELILTSWFHEMIAKYDWLSFRYEFSEKLGVFLVGYYPAEKVDANEEFCREAMRFEDEINAQFGIDAPLFGNEEDYFSLTSNAKEVRAAVQDIWSIPSQSFDMEITNYTFHIALHQSFDVNCISELEIAA